MATNLLQQMFMVVPTGKTATFKTLHVGKDATDDYYNKIAFLEETGEIVTKGVVYALNANLLNAADTVEGSIKYQIKTAIENIVNANENGAIDTLNEVIAWINEHKGVDGSSDGYIVTDVTKLQREVEGKTTFTKTTVTAEDGKTFTEGQKYSTDGTTVITAPAEGVTLPKGTTYYEVVEAEEGLLTRVQNLETTNTNLKYAAIADYTLADNADTKKGKDFTSGAMTNGTDGLVYGDVAYKIAEDAVAKLKYALDADETSTEGKSITVEVVQTDGVVSDVIVTESFATTTYTATADAVKFTQAEIDAAQEGDAAFGKTTNDVKTAAKTANLTVADADKDKALKASEVANIKSYVDDVVSVADRARQAAIAALDKVSSTVKNTQNGVDYTAVTYKEEDGIVTIESITNAIGAVAEQDNAMVVTTEGLIDAQALVTTLNAIDPWFEYTEESGE